MLIASAPQLTRAPWVTACEKAQLRQHANLVQEAPRAAEVSDRLPGWGFAGKYVLRQAPVKGQGFVSALAAEKHPPSRSALCRFFMARADYERERHLLSRLAAAELVPGGRTSLC